MKSHSWIAALLLAWLCATGCDRGTGSTSPTAIPSRRPAGSASVPAPGATVAARLAVSDFTVTVQPGESSQPRFTLTELGGISGATITSVAVWTSQETDVTGQSCWGTPIRVGPGGTLNTFNGGYFGLSYCAPVYDGVVTDSVSLTVSFVDDFGVIGTVDATTHTIIRRG